ncbi:conjugal transfer protein TraD [Sphingosinicella sp. CPCC 101087]|uniref:conjugal transfer protein TraD n=1 Tax=Sphingosinicella sp. CPCC 101087 TaxID=2497754 RepID=UPI00101B8138|nr:conjugal transfer protein TraD [Sphingosinicella sp. CPCC 101087]
MRKPRDYNSELKALQDKAVQLTARKVQQLGELVIATGADALPVELLAGALLTATDTSDLVTKEEWRTRGAAFFQKSRRSAGQGDRRQSAGTSTNRSGAGTASEQAST